MLPPIYVQNTRMLMRYFGLGRVSLKQRLVLLLQLKTHRDRFWLKTLLEKPTRSDVNVGGVEWRCCLRTCLL